MSRRDGSSERCIARRYTDALFPHLTFVAISVPAGGLIADRTGRIREVMLAGFACFASALLIAARTDDVVLWFVILGLVGRLVI